MLRRSLRVSFLSVLFFSLFQAAIRAKDFDVRAFGATGDGTTLDTDAINRAIEAASRERGEGNGNVVRFPAGTYLSFSIRLKSHLTLRLEEGATLVAADAPAEGVAGGYDAPEPNEWGDVHRYQDFGHSHWHNSLIWGENLENIAIVGPGRIHGKGLDRGRATRAGTGNKAIALKLCRKVELRDFSILAGGHFALLATGVDDLTLENLTIDTNRDGFDIDACRRVRVARCKVNAPNDDAIVLKTSFGLGFLRATEDVLIEDCLVSGYDVGTFLDGTKKKTLVRAPDRDGPTGRIKFGTESNGDFRRITIRRCVFERSRGLAIESVDGATIEDVRISDITMREVSNSALFIRLGARLRGPTGTKVGAIRRIDIRRVTATGADGRFPIIVAGLPGHPVEQVRIRDFSVASKGGVKLAQVEAQTSELVNPFFLRGNEPGATGPREVFAVPERTLAYPEPSMFGLLPACGMYVRHARLLDVAGLKLDFAEMDERGVLVLEDTDRTDFQRVTARVPEGRPLFVLRDVRNFRVRSRSSMTDKTVEKADRLTLP